MRGMSRSTSFLPAASLAAPGDFHLHQRPSVSKTLSVVDTSLLEEALRRSASITPGGTLLASASRLTAKDSRIDRRNLGRSGTSARGWQEDAADMYDLIGELHYLLNTVSRRSGQARFYVGEITEQGATPTPVEDDRVIQLFNSLGDDVAFGQLIRRMVLNLQLMGEGWLVGVPPHLFEEDVLPGTEIQMTREGGISRLFLEAEVTDTVTLEELRWFMCSVTEVTFDTTSQTGTTATIKTPEGEITALVDDLYMVRIWDPHAADASEPDCAVRAALPILRELDGLTRHVSAQIDSRLAGAGVFIVPESASRSFKAQAGLADDEDADPLTDALIESMSEPIEDRDSASAFVPLVLTVPDEAAEKFKHLSFSAPLDEKAKELRGEAIERLATALDAPPELLSGTAGMNHWGAWLVSEETVKSHIAPPLALIADALTAQFLRPAMRANGYPEEVIERTTIWFDIEHLMVRPSRTSDARDLYDRGELSGDTLREAHGFDSSDAPATAENGTAEQIVLEMIRTTPQLLQTTTVAILVEQVRGLLDQGAAAAPAPAPAPQSGSAPTSSNLPDPVNISEAPDGIR